MPLEPKMQKEYSTEKNFFNFVTFYSLCYAQEVSTIGATVSSIFNIFAFGNKLTIIPSSQIDFGHTILNAYDEVGTGAISVEKQHEKTVESQ